MKKPLVYISSPFTRGDQMMNIRFQCELFDDLQSTGIVLPVAPLWSGIQHLVMPRPYEYWMDYDLDLIERCDALLALDATSKYVDGKPYYEMRSSGRAREMKHAGNLGIPVFLTVGGVYKWTREKWHGEHNG